MSPSLSSSETNIALTSAPSAGSFTPVYFITAALLCLLFLTACGTGKKKPEQLAKYRTNVEEMMPVPYTPRDDGIPLSADELHAFKTVSDLDRGLSVEDAQIVELHFKYFVHQRRTTFARFLERTARFLPYIKKVFAERGIPEDIAYLAMVESGGNPNAISPAGAGGLWQFMPYTGKMYGLTQDSWIDERRDPYKATKAASDYLLKLQNDFSNWHLAVAAYNAGEGKIGRAVGGTGASDFFELCRLDGQLEEKARLKTETRDYVPRLIAMAKIMRNLKRLGFSEPDPNSAWDLVPLSVPAGTNLSGLARNLNLTWDEFSGMNPAYRRTASSPSSQSTAYVPPDKLHSAVIWVASAEARTYAGYKEYRVRKGDTFAAIAKRNKVRVDDLKQANNISKLPKVGSTILIPGAGGKGEPVYAALPETTSSPAASAGSYVVKSGDTLFSLAQKWGTDVASIRLANRMSPKDTVLTPGKRISVPGNSKNQPRPDAASNSNRQAKVNLEVSSGTQASYKVKPGDTVSTIARNNNVSVKDLCSANKLNVKKPLIKPGQTLLIPGKAKAAASSPSRQAAVTQAPANKEGKPAAAKTPPAKAKSVKVKSGDTLFGIAKSAGVSANDLKKINNLTEKSKLKPGQTLRLP